MKTQKLLAVLCAAALSACFLLGCANTGNTSGGGDSGKKPEAAVNQDLSRFETIKHYGLEEVVTHKIHIITPLVTFDGGFTDLELAVGSLMPKLNYTGLGYVVGVKNLMNGKTYDFNRFRMPDEEISVQIITSTEKPLEEKVLTPGINKNGAEKLDTSSSTANIVSKIGEDSIFTVNTAFSAMLDKRDVDIKGSSEDDLLRGSILSLTGKAGNFTRFLTGVGAGGTEAGIEKGKTYIFTYNVENKGEKEVSFKLFQVQTGVNLDSAVAVNCGKTITLKPGEHAAYKIIFTASDDNSNIIPVIQLQCEAEDAKVGVAITRTSGELPAHTHALEKFAAAKLDGDLTSNVEYYGCKECGAIFSDAEGKKPLKVTNVFYRTSAKEVE